LSEEPITDYLHQRMDLLRRKLEELKGLRTQIDAQIRQLSQLFKYYQTVHGVEHRLVDNGDFLSESIDLRVLDVQTPPFPSEMRPAKDSVSKAVRRLLSKGDRMTGGEIVGAIRDQYPDLAARVRDLPMAVAVTLSRGCRRQIFVRVDRNIYRASAAGTTEQRSEPNWQEMLRGLGHRERLIRMAKHNGGTITLARATDLLMQHDLTRSAKRGNVYENLKSLMRELVAQGAFQKGGRGDFILVALDSDIANVPGNGEIQRHAAPVAQLWL